jgi:hypothetical protein
MASTYAELRKLSDDDLIAAYDQLANSTCLGLAFYRDEIARRESDRLQAGMVKLTRQMHKMTLVILLATIVSTIFVVFQATRPASPAPARRAIQL